MINKDYFKNKKVVVMGLGLHGGGAAVARWLSKQKAKVIVTDVKTKIQLKESIEKLENLPIKYHLGGHKVEDFKNADIVVQNPAVPRESKYLKIARKNGVQIENEATIFFKLHNLDRIIGVTGTRGKSTVSTILYKILKKQDGKTKLAGNIKTTVMFDIVDKVRKDNWSVLELSSWHLENLGEKNISPHIAVVTNIMPDHLNRYRSYKDYIDAKQNILIFQKKSDIAVLNRENIHTQKMGKLCKGQRFWFSKKYFAQENGVYIKNKQIYFRNNGKEEKILNIKKIKLQGEHNLENILAAICVAKILNAKNKNIKDVFSSFNGLEERIELIKIINGVKYFDDTVSTIPQATIAAIKTLGKNKNIVLIAGGSDKKLNFKELALILKRNCKAVILFDGEASRKIFNELKKIKYKPIVTKVDSMLKAVTIAKSFAKKEDIVLLSPGSASFNMFENEYDRGRQFIQIVNKLK